MVLSRENSFHSLPLITKPLRERRILKHRGGCLRAGGVNSVGRNELAKSIGAVFDHALTRPWSVDKTYRRDPNPYPNWCRISCAEGNNYVVIGTDTYFLSGDGFLMPTKKDQAPPDLRYFRQTRTPK